MYTAIELLISQQIIPLLFDCSKKDWNHEKKKIGIALKNDNPTFFAQMNAHIRSWNSQMVLNEIFNFDSTFTDNHQFRTYPKVNRVIRKK